MFERLTCLQVPRRPPSRPTSSSGTSPPSTSEPRRTSVGSTQTTTGPERASSLPGGLQSKAQSFSAWAAACSKPKPSAVATALVRASHEGGNTSREGGRASHEGGGALSRKSSTPSSSPRPPSSPRSPLASLSQSTLLASARTHGSSHVRGASAGGDDGGPRGHRAAAAAEAGGLLRNVKVGAGGAAAPAWGSPKSGSPTAANASASQRRASFSAAYGLAADAHKR